MYRKYFIISGFFFSLLFAGFVNAQTTGGGDIDSPSSPATSGGDGDVIQGGTDFPDYMVYPREDLNPYGYSTMQKSSETNYRTDYGTFGTKLTQPSNIELNAPRRVEEEQKPESDLEGEGTPIDFVGEDTPVIDSSFLDEPTTRLYRWVDDEGVLHVTNDFGKIPQKYHDKALAGTQGTK